MHHEHTKTKMYTPVGLGEIMTHRSFTSTGEPNPLVKSKQETKHTLVVEGDKLVQEADKVWQPESVLASRRAPRVEAGEVYHVHDALR